MAKVITFSRTFPKYHPKAGQPTFFREKIWAGFADTQFPTFKIPDIITDWDWHEYYNAKPKYHTIRAGHRWKVGDKFSPRVWSGVPYRSPHIIIGPDIEIPKIWSLDIDGSDWYLDGRSQFALAGDGFDIFLLAKNDGLSFTDFDDWFVRSPEFKRKLAFSGQILCWNDKIDY